MRERRNSPRAGVGRVMGTHNPSPPYRLIHPLLPGLTTYALCFHHGLANAHPYYQHKTVSQTTQEKIPEPQGSIATIGAIGRLDMWGLAGG